MTHMDGAEYVNLVYLSFDPLTRLTYSPPSVCVIRAHKSWTKNHGKFEFREFVVWSFNPKTGCPVTYV